MQIGGSTAVSSECGYFVENVSAMVDFESATEFYYAPGGVVGYVQGGAEGSTSAAFN